MELIILGSSASYALPGEATAGYLVRSGDQSLVIDMGNGTLSNLFRWQDPADIQALILSHLHMDHVADVYPFRLYMNFEKPDLKLKVYAPKEAAKILSSPLSERGREIFENKLEFETINEGTIQIGDFKVTFANMVHDIDSFAVKVEINNKSLVYSADTAYNSKLAKLAQGCDLLLAEATFLLPIPEARHMTAADAAKLAKEADVKKLVLTHVWPTFKDERTLDEAAKYFDGAIDMAAANKVIKL